MYIVIELQKNSNGTLGNIIQTFENRNQAESTYHTVLASAAISQIPCHSAVLMTEEGQSLMNASYTHEIPATEPAPVVVEEEVEEPVDDTEE